MENINLTILTGAGISAESGIQTFRDAKTGLWENHSVEDVATPQGYEKDPALVQRFYNERRAQLKTVAPNAAHEALVKLEDFWFEHDIGGFLLITQNIDDLHERAGSMNVCHMHGELKKMRCVRCKEVTHIEDDIDLNEVCPSCRSVGTMRPHVVWFGEMPLYLDQIEIVLDHTNHYMAIGTSGNVMPASTFAEAISWNGFDGEFDERVEITLEMTGTPGFTNVIEGKATVEVVAYVDSLIERVTLLMEK